MQEIFRNMFKRMSVILILTATVIISYLAWLSYSSKHNVVVNLDKNRINTVRVDNIRQDNTPSINNSAKVTFLINKNNVNLNGYVASNKLKGEIASFVNKTSGKRVNYSNIKISTNKDSSHYRLISIAAVAVKYIKQGSIIIENNKIIINADFKSQERLDFLNKLVRNNLYKIHRYQSNLNLIK